MHYAGHRLQAAAMHKDMCTDPHHHHHLLLLLLLLLLPDAARAHLIVHLIALKDKIRYWMEAHCEMPFDRSCCEMPFDRSFELTS